MGESQINTGSPPMRQVTSVPKSFRKQVVASFSLGVQRLKFGEHKVPVSMLLPPPLHEKKPSWLCSQSISLDVPLQKTAQPDCGTQLCRQDCIWQRGGNLGEAQSLSMSARV